MITRYVWCPAGMREPVTDGETTYVRSEDYEKLQKVLLDFLRVALNAPAELIPDDILAPDAMSVRDVMKFASHFGGRAR